MQKKRGEQNDLKFPSSKISFISKNDK